MTRTYTMNVTEAGIAFQAKRMHEGALTAGDMHAAGIPMDLIEAVVHEADKLKIPLCSDCGKALRSGEMVYLTLGGLLQHRECMTAEQRERAAVAEHGF